MDRRTPTAVEPLTAFECEPWGAIEIKAVGPLETWILGAPAHQLSGRRTVSS